MTLTATQAASAVSLDGNGATTTFPWTYKAWDTDYIRVYLTLLSESSVIEITQDPSYDGKYTITLNPNGTGEVEYPLGGSGLDNLQTGEIITIRREEPFEQTEFDVENNQQILAEDIEDIIDRTTALVGQLEEEITLTVRVPVDGSIDPDDYLTDIEAAVDASAASASAADSSATESSGFADDSSDSADEAAASAATVADGQIPGTSITLDSDNVGAAVDTSVVMSGAAPDARMRFDVADNEYLFTDTIGEAARLSVSGIQLQGLTPLRALALTAAGSMVSSATSNTELGYVNGVTSHIQSQLDAKVILAGASAGQTINGGTDSGDTLVLNSTAHATKGTIILDDLLTVRSEDGRAELFSSTNPTLRIISEDGSGDNYTDIRDDATSLFQIKKVVDSGTAFIDFSPIPVDETGASFFRIFSDVNTTGAAKFIVFKGDGTATQNAVISGNKDSFVCADNNDFAIGHSLPTEKLHVIGNAIITGAYDVTTASAANVFVESTGQLKRSTSSAKYKKGIRNLGFDPKVIFDLHPKSFESIADKDKTFFGLVAEEVHEVCPELVGYKPIYSTTAIEHADPEFNVGYSGDSLLEPITIMAGEDNETIGWKEFIKTGEEPDWVMYDRLPILMLPIITELKDRVKTQQQLINDLVARVEALEQA